MKFQRKTITIIIVGLIGAFLAWLVLDAWSVITPDRINRVTKIPITSNLQEVHLQLPKGTWQIVRSGHTEDVGGGFKVVSTDHPIRKHSDTSDRFTFSTTEFVTKLVVECSSPGPYKNSFMEVRAGF